MVHTKYLKFSENGNHCLLYALVQILYFNLIVQSVLCQALLCDVDCNKTVASTEELKLNKSNTTLNEFNLNSERGINNQYNGSNGSSISVISTEYEDSSTIFTDFIFKLKTYKTFHKLLSIFKMSSRTSSNASVIQINQSNATSTIILASLYDFDSSNRTQDSGSFRNQASILNNSMVTEISENITSFTKTTSLTDSSSTSTKPSKIPVTISKDNPQFLACINACGTDHDCVREKCLLDSTYFG